MFRSDADAARARLASLVRAIAERRGTRLALGRYRHALSDEASRLRRALRGYEKSARSGRRLRRPYDLTPAELELPPLPGADRLIRALGRFDPAELTARADRLARELAEDDPRATWLEEEVVRLRAECASLRKSLDSKRPPGI